MARGSASCDWVCRQYVANRDSISWADFQGYTYIGEAPGAEGLLVWGHQWWATHIAIKGRGDFDGDGWDDIMLLASYAPTPGVSDGTELFLFTRDDPDAVLRVIEPETHLCKNYHPCETSYDQPPSLRSQDEE